MRPIDVTLLFTNSRKRKLQKSIVYLHKTQSSDYAVALILFHFH